ncbi:Crp/Fnr family transcriptional regulator [Lunatibacter salilacus]|uniref:Crp/Fnr family transcriptional regulator n=1 Tax=Lunatibacter salilacus TaxID=2483804 RepID=UPI00131B03B0|nr:Crp/Fnr family transcriptional regulator [Lunatibacter salilacus]
MRKDLNMLVKIFVKFDGLDEDSIDQFLDIAILKDFKKGELLVREGEVCDKLFFVEQGLVRSFYHKEVKDVTISFSLAGEFITSMSGFITQKPTYENIEALEDCVVLEFGKEKLNELFVREPNWVNIYRQILEEYYVKLEEHLIFSKFKTAKERYYELINKKPQIIKTASIGQIASYLGINIETLSRIRAGR